MLTNVILDLTGASLNVNGQVAHDVDIDRYLTEKHNDLEVQ